MEPVRRSRKEDTTRVQTTDKLPPLAPGRPQKLDKPPGSEGQLNSQLVQRSKGNTSNTYRELPASSLPSQQTLAFDDSGGRASKPLPPHSRPPRLGHKQANIEQSQLESGPIKETLRANASNQQAPRASSSRRSTTPKGIKIGEGPLPQAPKPLANEARPARNHVQSTKSTVCDDGYSVASLEKVHSSDNLNHAREFMSDDLKRVIDEKEVTYSWSRKKGNQEVNHQDAPKANPALASPPPVTVDSHDTDHDAPGIASEPRTNSRGKLQSRGRDRSQGREPEAKPMDAALGKPHASKKISFDPKQLVLVSQEAPTNGTSKKKNKDEKGQLRAIDLSTAQELKQQRMKTCAQRCDLLVKVVAYDGGAVSLSTGALSKSCGKQLLQWMHGELSNEFACLHIDDWTQGQVTWPEIPGSALQTRFGLVVGMLTDVSLKRTHIASLRSDCFSSSPWESVRRAVEAVIDIARPEGSTMLASEVENALVCLESFADAKGVSKQLEAAVHRELLRLLWSEKSVSFEAPDLDDAWLVRFLAQSSQEVRDLANATPVATLREQNEFLETYLVRLLRVKRALVTLVDQWEKVDYYAILGVSPTASDKEIKVAYRKACLRLHPDKGGDKTQFQQLQDAYAHILEERAKNSSDKSADSNVEKQGQNKWQAGQNAATAKPSTCLRLENDSDTVKASAKKDQEDSADDEVNTAQHRLNDLVETINAHVYSAEQAEAKVHRLKKDKGGVDALQSAQEAGKAMLDLSEELGTLGHAFSEAVMEVAESSLALAARFAMIPSAMLLTDVALSCTFEASRIQHAAEQLKEVRRDTVSTLQTLETNLSMAKIIGSIDAETFKLSLGLVAKATSRIISSVRLLALAVKDATQRGRQCKVHAKAVVAFASGRKAADIEAEDDLLHAALPAPESCNPEPEVTSQEPRQAETKSPHKAEEHMASGQQPNVSPPNEWSVAIHQLLQNHKLFQQINSDLIALQQRARTHLSKCGKSQQLVDCPASDCDLVFQLVGEVLLAASEATIDALHVASADGEQLESLLAQHFGFVERCGASLASTLDLRTQLVRLAALLDAQAVIIALEKEVKPRLAIHCGGIANTELRALLLGILDRQFELLCSAVVAARLA